MQNRSPMWWVAQSRRPDAAAHPAQTGGAHPNPLLRMLPEDLLQKIRGLDSDTVLILLLIALMKKEQADYKLLLALGYILM